MTERVTDGSIFRMAEASPDMVFLVDRAGTIQYVNAPCASTLGFAASDLVGQRILELVVPRDREKTLHEASLVLAGHKREGFENRYQHRNGSDIHLAWSARWLETNQLRLGVARDITVQRQPACAHMVPATLLDALAPQEQDVFLLLLTAASESQIAARLGLGAATMVNRVMSIYRKLGVRGRLGLMSLYLGGFNGVEPGARQS